MFKNAVISNASDEPSLQHIAHTTDREQLVSAHHTADVWVFNAFI